MPACSSNVSEFIDEGHACLLGREIDDTSPGVRYGAGASIPIDVRDGPCMSGSCDELRWSTCEVELEGDAWVIRTEARVFSKPRLSCTADCIFVQYPPCEIDGLPAGTHRVVYGDDELELTIPYEGPELCLGE